MLKMYDKVKVPSVRKEASCKSGLKMWSKTTGSMEQKPCEFENQERKMV